MRTPWLAVLALSLAGCSAGDSDPTSRRAASLVQPAIAVGADGGSSSAALAPLSVPTSAVAGCPVYRINAGGQATEGFLIDQDVNSGGTYGYGNVSVDTAGVVGAAPAAIYSDFHLGDVAAQGAGPDAGATKGLPEPYLPFTYTLSGLAAGHGYTVRLHFAELNVQGVGQAVLNVQANGATLEANLDVFARVGFAKALVTEHQVSADAQGSLALTFVPIVGMGTVAGLELFDPSGLSCSPDSGLQLATGPATDSNACTGPAILQINSGGDAREGFQADVDFDVGGSYAHHELTVDTTGVANAAPADLYQDFRYSFTLPQTPFAYRLPDFTAGTTYRVRLHFADLDFTQAGQQVFDVVSGVTILESQLDIFARAGQGKALVIDHDLTANADGTIALEFLPVVQMATVSAIEVFPLHPCSAN